MMELRLCVVAECLFCPTVFDPWWKSKKTSSSPQPANYTPPTPRHPPPSSSSTSRKNKPTTKTEVVLVSPQTADALRRPVTGPTGWTGPHPPQYP